MMCRGAIIRYIVIDKCLGSYNEPLTKCEIRNKVNEKLADLGIRPVSLRTITQDLMDLREREIFDAPIKLFRDEENVVRYKYSIPYYSIFTKNRVYGKLR